MLKTLRITSIIAVIIASLGVAVLIFMGLKENPKVRDFLDSPGIAARFKDRVEGKSGEEAKISPLVAQAKAFALRIDPPPPPKPVVKDVPKQPSETVKREPAKPPIPTPKVAVSVKSDLLATVVYAAAPEKSLALLQTSGNKQEWFRQGEKVGHLEIKEIRDGSVIFTQGGQNPQEKFVPPKTPVGSLLKGDRAASTSPVPTSGFGGAGIPRPSLENAVDRSTGVQPGINLSGPDSARVNRFIDRTESRSTTDVSTRIQRARSVPVQPTPREQKETINETLSGIEEIMNRQDESLSEEEREDENKMWAELIEALKTEKESLDTAVETEGRPEDDSKEEPVSEPEDAAESGASDPNESE